MLKFSQKNQHFSTLDLLLLVVLVGGVFTAFGAVLAQGLQDNRLARAHSSAEAYAIQLVEQQLRAHRANSGTESRASRGIASVQESSVVGLPPSGDIGRDPWGRPFHYRVVSSSDSEDSKRKVIVWSDGPNRRPESMVATDGSSTNEALWTSSSTSSANLKPSTFGGDDIGFVKEDTSEM